MDPQSCHVVEPCNSGSSVAAQPGTDDRCALGITITICQYLKLVTADFSETTDICRIYPAWYSGTKLHTLPWLPRIWRKRSTSEQELRPWENPIYARIQKRCQSTNRVACLSEYIHTFLSYMYPLFKYDFKCKTNKNIYTNLCQPLQNWLSQQPKELTKISQLFSLCIY